MAKGKIPKASLDRETWIIVTIVGVGILWALSGAVFHPIRSSHSSSMDSGKAHSLKDPPSLKVPLSANHIPLATGNEPIEKLFIQSGCAVCHTIPGIQAAKGRQCPLLLLGTNGPKRLANPNYHGRATTVREYIIESILTPGAFIVPGYPDRVMPQWFGKKLSARALDKIVTYLETLAEHSPKE